jgi:GDSL-like lipase/acylhydrolase family protein
MRLPRHPAVVLAALVMLGCTMEVGADQDAATVDAALADAGDQAMLDASTPDAEPPLEGPVLYPADRRHSPIAADTVAAWRDVAARAPSAAGDTFAKVGDSITVEPSFLGCFAGTNVDLDGRDALSATIDRFRDGDAAGTDPFRRTSAAAGIGWSASAVLAGDPPPLVRELEALEPRFAVVMFGTNDVGFRSEEAYARDMLDIVDIVLSYGAIPILSSIPPRDDSADADARVPLFNLAIRAIAQGRGVPFVDYHRELMPLPGHGLAGDGVHPRAYSGGACVLTAAGLQHGVNVRNLITIEALDRAVRALSGEAFDDATRLHGVGRSEAPFAIEMWPFAVLGDSRRGTRERQLYSGCGATQNESGPEQVYRIVLDAPARITVTVLSARGADIDVHLLDESASEGGCIARANRSVTADLPAGTFHVVADTFVGAAGELAGEYLLLAQRD